MKSAPRTRDFVVVTLSFVAVFAASASVIPLSGLYRSQHGLTPADFALAAGTYFVFAVLSLLLLGRLSDHLGRRPVSIGALLLAASGCFVLTTVDGVAVLTIGRALQGVAAGLAATALAAFVVDAAPANRRWLVPVITGSASTVGLALGAVGSGLLTEFGPWPAGLSFTVAAGALVLLAALVGMSAETVATRAGVLRALRPEIRVPRAIRPLLPAAAAVWVSTWALGGYFQSFAPLVTADYLGSDDTLVAAVVFAAYTAPAALGSFVTARLDPRVAQYAGGAALVVAAAGMVAAVGIGAAALFLAAAVLGGIAMGVALTGTMKRLLPLTAPAERAGMLAVVYLVSYSGAALPSLLAGQASRFVSLFGITIGFASLTACALAVIVTAGALERPQASPR